MLEWDGAGNWLAWNIYGAGPDEILARNDGLFYKQDQRGNVVALLDPSNNIIEKYTYDAFGTPTITDASGNVRPESWYGNRFMITGREYIKELGIYDYRNRMYQPELGRFLQKDPIGFDAGDANLFRYCGDDPVNRTNPSGLQDIPFFPSQDYLNNLTGQYYSNQTAGFGAANNFASAYNAGLAIAGHPYTRFLWGSIEIRSGVKGFAEGVSLYAIPHPATRALGGLQIGVSSAEIKMGWDNVGAAANGQGWNVGPRLNC